MHIYLIGYRGSGKTTVGKLLAERLDLPLIDSDQQIVELAGKSIRDIFAEQGEEAFRDLETRVIGCIGGTAQAEPSVVSLGGGAILRGANRECLIQSGRRIWLTGHPEVLYRRITSDDATTENRPQLSDSGGYKEVADVLAARQPIYQELAQMTVDTDSKTPDEVVEEILHWVNSPANRTAG